MKNVNGLFRALIFFQTLIRSAAYLISNTKPHGVFMKKIISMMAFCLVLSIFGPSAYAQRTAEDLYKASFTRLSNRDLEGAMAALDKAIALKPDFAKAYAQRSRLHMMKGELDTALGDLNKALELDSEMALEYQERGHLRMMKNDMSGALNDFNNAIARGYRSDEIFASRGQLKLMSQDFKGAIGDFDTAISMNQHRIGYYVSRSAARSLSGDEAGALADNNYVIEKFEQQERERKAAGKTTRQAPGFDLTSPVIKGPESAALPAPGKSEGVTMKTESVVVMKMDTNMDNAMTPEQMEYLPNVAGAYLNRGLSYSKKGDSDAALADFNKAVEVNPHDFAVYLTRGRELQKRGDLNAALDDFNKAIQVGPQMSEIYLERGVTLFLLGKDAEAQKDFDQCLKLDPRMDVYLERRRAEAKKQKEAKPQ
jgi:tetratricopeptide (TPR) repeat protein